MLPNLTKVQRAMIDMAPIEYEELVRFVFESIYKHRQGFTIVHSGKEYAKDHPSKHPIDIEISYFDDNSYMHHIFIAVSNQKDKLYSAKGKLACDCNSIISYVNSLRIDNVEIIAAYAKSPTSAGYAEYVLLQNQLQSQGMKLTLVNADTLNVYINEYCPSAYSRFLNINAYSGGISYLDDHIENKLGEYYKNELIGRETELNQLKEALIQKRVVLLRGHSGCGKTRLAIELAKTAFPSNYKCLWVESFNLSSSGDLDYFYEKNKKNIIIIDDINKISFFNELLNKILQKENTYVIMTIRDYLFDDYKQRIDLQYHEYHLHDLEPNKIKIVLKKLFKIDDAFSDYVLLVTRNNLRFSIMATKELLVDGKTHQNINDIFDAYYKELINKTGIETNETLKRTIAALAFFDSIDLRSEENNKSICSVFGIPKDDFLEMCNIAHEKEIADFYFDRMFIKISDQIFAEYLFYKYVFVYKKIDLFTLFTTYYKTRKQKFVQIVKALLNTYYDDSNFIEQLNVFKSKVLSSQNKELIISFFLIFSKVFVSDAIEYSYNELKECDCLFGENYKEILDAESYGDLFSILLSNYDSKQYSKLVKLLLTLLTKINLRHILLTKIESECSIRKDNYLNILKFYTELLNGLIDLSTDNNDYLESLLIIVKKIYPYESEYSDYNGENGLIFCRLVLPFDDSVEKLRSFMWKAIGLLHERCFDDGKLIETVKHNYSTANIDRYKKFDSQCALNIVRGLDFSKPRNIVFTYNLLNQFLRFQNVKEFINSLQVDDEAKLYFDFVISKHSNKYGDEYKNALIKECFKKYPSTFEFVNMLSHFYQNYGDTNSWVVNNIVACGFEYLASLNKQHYDQHLINFLLSNPNYSGNPCFLVFSINDKTSFLRWIEQMSLINKNSFIASVLFDYKKDEINDELYGYALNFFSKKFITAPSGWGNENIVSLKNFEEYKPGFIYNVLKNITVDSSSAHFVEVLFYVKEPIEDIFKVLNYDLKLFKRVYFELLTCSRFYDHDGRVTMFMLEKDPSSLKNILQLIVDGKTDIDKIVYLYSYPTFVETFIDIIISSRFAHINFAISHCIEKMPNDVYVSLIKEFINRYKDNFNYMHEFSKIVEHRDLKSQVYFVNSLIENKVDIEIFERLFLFGGPTSWSGSRIHYLKDNIDAIKNYLDSNSIPDLYKNELEKTIDRIKKSIRYEEIEEFNRGY